MVDGHQWMTSLVEKHRVIVMPLRTCTRNTWQKTEDKDGKAVYTNLLIRRTVEILAQGEKEIRY